jgi:hypothetical protein
MNSIQQSHSKSTFPPLWCFILHFKAWWNAWRMHCTYHTWSFLCLIIAMNDVNIVDGLHLFLIMSGVVMMILWSTFAIHQMCMWGVRFFPIWNWWLYGSVRESQMQHFHLQIMISWLCHPALWTLKWPLSSI